MTKLNQILAIEHGVKGRAERTLTDAYHTVQKAPPLSGITRTYVPKDDEGDQLPPESTLVQTKVEDVMREVTQVLTRQFDVTATKDVANTTAMADIVVNGVTILAQVPATYLLFLEKKLIDLRTFITKMPTLDPSEEWEFDDVSGTWRTRPIQTTKTKKVPKNWVKAEATDKHPAQVEVYHEDVLVGTWTTTKFSGALPASRQQTLLTRVDSLYEAVRCARVAANDMEVTDMKTGEPVFDYLFA